MVKTEEEEKGGGAGFYRFGIWGLGKVLLPDALWLQCFLL